MPPGNIPWRGRLLPLSAIVGGLGTFSAWVVVMALNTRTLVIGMAWMLIGLTVYVLFRRSQGLGLRQTVKVVTPEPLGVQEIEYHSILVAFEDDAPFSEEMIATAVKLASKRRRGIHVHSMLTVPAHLPLQAEMGEREAGPASKIEQAKLIGGRRVTGHVARVRPGQAGYSISDEAKETDAAAIIVGLRFRNGAPRYDKTLQTVLAERPCRVIVVSEGPGRAAPGLPSEEPRPPLRA
jgi:APA family basic amino acid/polyamine antiporter